MRDTVKLEMSDWEEIVEALASKIGQIEMGHFGKEDYPGQDKEWIAHLRRIIRKIEGHKFDGIHLAVFKKAVITINGGKKS